MKLINQNVDLICEYLNESKIVAIPTETVYGLAIKMNDNDLINKLCDLKQRHDKVFSMMIADKNEIDKYAIVNEKAKNIIEKYFPGELTLILPINPEFDNKYFKMQDGTIGIRIPNHELMLEVLKKCGPLFVTSANLSGAKECNTSEEVIEHLRDVDVIVNGKSGRQKPSTVIKIVNDKIEVIRQGDLVIE